MGVFCSSIINSICLKKGVCMKLLWPPWNNSSDVHQTRLKISQRCTELCKRFDLWKAADRGLWQGTAQVLEGSLYVPVCAHPHTCLCGEPGAPSCPKPLISIPSHCKVQLQSESCLSLRERALVAAKHELRKAEAYNPSLLQPRRAIACINSSTAWWEQSREANMIDRSNFLLCHLWLRLYKCSSSCLLQMLLRHWEPSVNNDQSL